MAHGMILIDQERCKGCSLCIEVCPQHVITINTGRLNAKSYHPAGLDDPGGKCTGCAICAVICPDACITVLREPPLRRGVGLSSPTVERML